MPLDYNDPYILKFLKENYEREKDKRVGWFLANKAQLVEHATITEKHKGYRVDDILRAPVNICIPMLIKHHKVSQVNRRKKVGADGPILGLSWIKKNQIVQPIHVMKPVSAIESSILYDTTSGGLREYHNVRKRKIPEEKYYFCETSSNVIGWQWKDSAFSIRPPKYGRRNTLLREAGRSGPQPDPPHYEKPQWS